MRFITWNCCWKLEEKLPVLLAEMPDVAVVQECSRRSLEHLPEEYRGEWLGGPENHGLGLISREPYDLCNVTMANPQGYFARIDIEGPVRFRLIAAWNCPPEGSSYNSNLHSFLDEHLDWFDAAPILFAGDLNSQNGASFDTGKRKHCEFEERMREKHLVDAYAAVRGPLDSTLREATHRHQWNVAKPFHLDYVYVPELWLPRISGLTVGAPIFWSRFSDHSPVMLSVSDTAP